MDEVKKVFWSRQGLGFSGPASDGISEQDFLLSSNLGIPMLVGSCSDCVIENSLDHPGIMASLIWVPNLCTIQNSTKMGDLQRTPDHLQGSEDHRGPRTLEGHFPALG